MRLVIIFSAFYLVIVALVMSSCSPTKSQLKQAEEKAYQLGLNDSKNECIRDCDEFKQKAGREIQKLRNEVRATAKTYQKKPNPEKTAQQLEDRMRDNIYQDFGAGK